METVGSYEAKTHLPALLERVSQGASITITRHGVPIAKLVPIEPRSSMSVQEAIDGLIQFGKGRRLPKGVTVRDLIQEGRRY